MSEAERSFYQPHWKPPHVGQRVSVIGTKLQWLITSIDGMVVTLERRDEQGKHIEQQYSIQMILAAK